MLVQLSDVQCSECLVVLLFYSFSPAGLSFCAFVTLFSPQSNINELRVGSRPSVDGSECVSQHGCLFEQWFSK